MNKKDSHTKDLKPAPAGAFRSIYEAEGAYVWGYLRQLGVPTRDLEDKVQDVFVALYRCWERYDTRRPLRPWITGICFRVASDYRRKASNHREQIGFATESTDHTPGPEELVARQQLATLALLALQLLDPDRRLVFVLHDLEGRTVPSIAQGLQVPSNTLYSRLYNARRKLREAVEHLDTPGLDERQ